MLITPKQLGRWEPPPCVRVVSLDIFDTLIWRSVDPPPFVTALVAARLAALRVILCSSEEYLRLRRDAELRLRESLAAAGQEPECSLEEIACSIARFLGLTPKVVQEMMAIELEVESRLLITAPGMRSFLERLCARHRLIAVSDTHLSQQQLAYLLRQAGLDHCFAAIYASCDYRCSKRMGGLFDVVLSSEGLRPEELVHLGDNFHSDYLSARKRDISALYLYDYSNLARRAKLRVQGNSGYHFFFGGAPSQSGASPRESLLQGFAYSHFGPLLTIFTHLLKRELTASGCDAAFFLARDGYLLKQLFEHGDWVSKSIETGYLSVSRYTAALASVRSLGAREVILIGFACRTLRDALKRLAVEKDPLLSPLVSRLGLSLESVLTQDELYNSLASLFALPEFKAMALPVAAEMRRILRIYLAEQGFFAKGRKVALIDIGWHGTIQECLETAFGDDLEYPEVHGFYFGLVEPLIPCSSERQGLLLDYRSADADANTLFLYQELWELVCRGFHGSTTGYCEKNSHIVPIWNDSDRQDSGHELFCQVLALQQGVSTCAADFALRAELCPADLVSLAENARALFDAAFSFPDPAVAAIFDDCRHSIDFGNDRLQDIAPKFGLKDFERPNVLIGHFLAAPWREGALVKSGFPCLTLYYVVKRWQCWRRSGIMKKLFYCPDAETFLPALVVDTMCCFLGVVARKSGYRALLRGILYSQVISALRARTYIATSSLILRLLVLLPVRLAEHVFCFIMKVKGTI